MTWNTRIASRTLKTRNGVRNLDTQVPIRERSHATKQCTMRARPLTC